MNDLLNFIEQILGSADAESGDQDRTTVFEAGLDPCLQGLHALFSTGMGFVAVSTFQNQGIRAVRRFWCGKQGRMRSTQIARKDGCVLLLTSPRLNVDKGGP